MIDKHTEFLLFALGPHQALYRLRTAKVCTTKLNCGCKSEKWTSTMSEIIIKADIRAIRRWLGSVEADKGMPAQDRWLAAQTREKLNDLIAQLEKAQKS